MPYMRPPKNYETSDFPLPHNMVQQGGLGIDGTSKNATYFPILLGDRGLVNADLVIANPEHASFAESATPYCYKNSIITDIMVSMKFNMSKVAIETDALRKITVNWLPVYTAFLSRLTAEDSKSTNTTAEILSLESEAVGKSVYPIWSAVNLDHGLAIGIHANATTALMGRTTDGVQESISFNTNTFFDAMHYYTNRNMLKKMVGKNTRTVIKRDHGYTYYNKRFGNSIAKRINDYTFCGILVYADKSGKYGQTCLATDTTDINHIDMSCIIRYNEWNSEFDQTAT